MRLPVPMVTAAAAGMLAVVVLAGPAASQDPPAAPSIEVFSKDRTERSTDLDLGRRGASMGDRTLARGPLYAPADTSRRVGSYTAELVSLDPGRLLTQMTVTVVLADGQITVGGSLPFERTLRQAGAVLPITGGTGAYALARGTATLRARKIGRDDGFAFTIDVVR
ncbi:MAG: Dirigent-like protein [Solirubrobacteraceae bacterium]|nr:Dirigent-like protein [Solirubrobacteraceae bacterium]